MLVGGILFLAFQALSRGPTELTALAAVLAAGASLLANMENKQK